MKRELREIKEQSKSSASALALLLMRLATVVVLMRSAVFFMITHYSSLLRLAELEWTCSWPCLRLGVYVQHD